MAEKPSPDDISRLHHWFAMEANNRAWSLSEKAEMGVEDAAEMLTVAHAAAWHWRQVGTTNQRQLADLLIARVHARLNDGPRALAAAERAFAAITARVAAPWERAFAHAILADAARASGDAARHASHYAEARALGAALTDPEDREIFHATFDRIPSPGL